MQLVRFLMKLASEYVQIELKNGTVVAGTVVSVAPNMNTVLKDAKMTVPHEEPASMDTITLRGSTIRHYILPETLPLDTMIKPETRRAQHTRPAPASTTRGRGSTLARGRGGRGAARGPLRGSRGRGRGARRGTPYGPASGTRGGFGNTRGTGPGRRPAADA